MYKRQKFKPIISLVLLLLMSCSGAEERVGRRPYSHGALTGELATTTTVTEAPRVIVKQVSRGNRLPRYSGPITDETFWKLSLCEAGGRPDAVSRSGKYFGAFQFSLATWRGIGMSGNPIDYPYSVQLEAAKRLQARSGWGQWPTCSRKLGLR